VFAYWSIKRKEFLGVWKILSLRDYFPSLFQSDILVCNLYFAMPGFIVADFFV